MNLETFNPAFGGQSRARHFAERLNVEIIKTCAARRVCDGVALGDRAAPGAAAARMELVDLDDVEAVVLADVDGIATAVTVFKPVTDPGKKTARRKMPRVLAVMGRHDMRRRAAEAYADAAERVGSVAGASLDDQVDGGQGSSDGGASTRMAHVSVLRASVAALMDDGVARVSLAPGNARGDRKPIMAADLVRAVCVDGRDLKSILRGHGWSGQGRDVMALRLELEALLERMALALGLDRGMRPLV